MPVSAPGTGHPMIKVPLPSASVSSLQEIRRDCYHTQGQLGQWALKAI